MNGSDYKCAEPQWEFTRDVLVYPPVVSSGDTVTLTASVRNFSNLPAGDVTVAFYQGDPDAGGMLLGYGERDGGQTIDLAPRDVKSVSLQTQVSGYGEQRIYAVIDPEDELAEVHDENDPVINNNKGYSFLTIGAFDFVDMGLAAEQAYYPLSYSMADNLHVTAYVPTAVLSETVRVELQDAPAAAPLTPRKPFKLAVYWGSMGWEKERPDYDLGLGPDDPPVVIMLERAGAHATSLDQDDVVLYRLGDDGWEEATCPGYQVYRFPDDNVTVVPICQTGVFVFTEPFTGIFLPLVLRNQ
jgi:hypothetical protein